MWHLPGIQLSTLAAEVLLATRFEGWEGCNDSCCKRFLQFLVCFCFCFLFNTYYVWHAAKCLASNVACFVVRAYARLRLNLAGLNLFACPHSQPFCPVLFLRTAFLIFKCNNFLACNFIFWVLCDGSASCACVINITSNLPVYDSVNAFRAHTHTHTLIETTPHTPTRCRRSRHINTCTDIHLDALPV